MNVSFGAEQSPFALSAPIVAVERRTGSYIPDEHGQKQWMLTKGLMHGGISQANSGSPVFVGDCLYGLNEMSPFLALVADPQDATGPQTLRTGICVSTPRDVESILRQAGLWEMCIRLD